MKIPKPIDESLVTSEALEETIIASAMLAAAEFAHDVELFPFDVDSISSDDRVRVASTVQSSGASFTVPLLIPEGMESGDGRSFENGALSHRFLPIPLMWQIKTGPGHDGSVIVGRIDSIEYVGNGLGNAKGVFDVGPYGREAERLVRGKFLRGISADLDKFEASKKDDEDDELADKDSIKSDKLTVSKGRVMAATLVAKPAFQECFITLDEEPMLTTEAEFVSDGEYVEFLDDIDSELAALAASAAPIIPPKKWFTNPRLDNATPLTTTDDGRVFGHIALWDTNHIGLPRATRPPRSATNYAYFCTGALRTDEGDVYVGQLTLAGGHADMTFSARDAVKHYDDTDSAVADVTAGEDEYGIWVAGALRPEVTPQQVRAFRASAPSGDWRPIDGRLELVAVCNVNVPGFPIARSLVAGGQIQALVAAGALPLAQMRENKLERLEERINSIESIELSARREAALARMKPLQLKKDAELEALAASAAQRLLPLKQKQQEQLSAQIAELKNRILKKN